MDIASIPDLVQACLDLQRQTLSPLAMKERIEFSEYANNSYGYAYSPAETSIPGFRSDINRTIYSLHQENEDLRRKNERLRERFRLEVEPKVHCKRSFTTASGGSTTIETASTSGVHDKFLGTDRRATYKSMKLNSVPSFRDFLS